MSESILYQEEDAYFSSEVYQSAPGYCSPVTVTRNGLKVGDQVHTFEGVHQASLQIVWKSPVNHEAQNRHWVAKLYDQITGWIFGLFFGVALLFLAVCTGYAAAVGEFGNTGRMLLVVAAVVVGAVVYLLVELKRQKRFHVAEIVLTRNNGTKVIPIGTYHQLPKAEIILVKQPPAEVYWQSVKRVKRIKEAVALAILHSASTELATR